MKKLILASIMIFTTITLLNSCTEKNATTNATSNATENVVDTTVNATENVKDTLQK